MTTNRKAALAGALMAAVVPTIASADFEMLHLFREGEVVSAEKINENFSDIKNEVEQLREEVQALNDRKELRIGQTIGYTGVARESTELHYAAADGVLNTSCSGNTYIEIQTDVSVGSSRDLATSEVAIDCGISPCTFLRATQGSGISVVVPAGSYFSIRSSNSTGTGTVGTRWTPLTEDLTLPVVVAEQSNL